MAGWEKKVPAFKRPFKAVPLRRVRNPPPLRFWEPKPPTWRQSLHQMRPWLLAVALLTVAAVTYDYDRHAHPARTEHFDAHVKAKPVARPGTSVVHIAEDTTTNLVEGTRASTASAAEDVGDRFTRCGYGRGVNCVIDGDTFKIGQRKIRVSGIDAAELHGQCVAETARAEASTRALQDWLNRGPFDITPDPAPPHDKYGRELMIVTRGGDRLADYMTSQGGAHPYAGGARGGWC